VQGSINQRQRHPLSFLKETALPGLKIRVIFLADTVTGATTTLAGSDQSFLAIPKACPNDQWKLKLRT
jgi:hypothetical protein